MDKPCVDKVVFVVKSPKYHPRDTLKTWAFPSPKISEVEKEQLRQALLEATTGARAEIFPASWAQLPEVLNCRLFGFGPVQW